MDIEMQIALIQMHRLSTSQLRGGGGEGVLSQDEQVKRVAQYVYASIQDHHHNSYLGRGDCKVDKQRGPQICLD